jgi:hydrogenase-4 component B
VLVGATAVLMLLRGNRRAAPSPTWACGQLVEPSLRWTSAGFTKPLRLVLEVVLRPEREVTSRTDGGVLQEVAYSGHVPHLIEERVYRPIERASVLGAAHARRLQTGSVGTYVVYLIALVVVLLAAVRLGLIG